jgi:hypothetical protein
MRKLFKTMIIAAVAATPLFAAPPPKYLDVDVNWQQTQELETLNIQQGASMRLRVRPKIDGKWLTLTGLTARWEARETATNASSYQATSNLTSNEAHWVQIELDNTQTGTAITSWLYSVILINGADEYPIGIGTVNVVASDFAGSSSVLVGSGYETNSVRVIESVSTLNFEDGFLFDYDGTNKLSVSVDSSTSGDITAVQVSGSILTVASGTGPIPIVGLTTAAVQAAQSAETDPVWGAVSNSVTSDIDAIEAKTNTWNNAVQKDGDTMTGNLAFTEGVVVGDIVFKPVIGTTDAAEDVSFGQFSAGGYGIDGPYMVVRKTGHASNPNGIDFVVPSSKAIRYLYGFGTVGAIISNGVVSADEFVGGGVSLTGITSNSIAAATDTAYRSGGTTYTAGTNLDLIGGTDFNLNAPAVASLALADSALQSYTELDPIWTAVSNTVTAGAAAGSTALQSYTETDPIWIAVSNTVTANALLGSTALQTEVQDIAAVVALDGDIGTGNITSAAGGTTLDMSSGKFYSSGGTVDISGGTGPALSGSAFSASIDATTGNQIVGWSVLTNQIALLGGGEVITTVTAGVSPHTATATTSINYINANTTTVGGAITVDLPDAAAAINKVFHIKKLGTSGNVIVDAAGANTIDGQATMTISGQWSSMHIVSDGNNWFIH